MQQFEEISEEDEKSFKFDTGSRSGNRSNPYRPLIVNRTGSYRGNR
jgi:hypothetical protein